MCVAGMLTFDNDSPFYEYIVITHNNYCIMIEWMIPCDFIVQNVADGTANPDSPFRFGDNVWNCGICLLC